MKYFWNTVKHKWYIFLASFRTGLPIWRVIIHDLSKFTKAELPHYEREFFGDKGDPLGFARAWLHHQNRNDHHPEYWITRADHSHGYANGATGDICILMPDVCVAEMITDWLAASRTHTGSWDMTGWLKENLGKKRWHMDTEQSVLYELKRLGIVSRKVYDELQGS